MRSLTKAVLGVLGGLFTLWVGWGVYVRRTTERIPYEPLEQFDGVELRRYPRTVLVEATNWRPDRIGLFGGAIRFWEYGFLLGALMKRVVKSGFPEVDASDDVEFTDWESVDAFATFVEERIGDARGTG